MSISSVAGNGRADGFGGGNSSWRYVHLDLFSKIIVVGEEALSRLWGDERFGVVVPFCGAQWNSHSYKSIGNHPQINASLTTKTKCVRIMGNINYQFSFMVLPKLWFVSNGKNDSTKGGNVIFSRIKFCVGRPGFFNNLTLIR